MKDKLLRAKQIYVQQGPAHLAERTYRFTRRTAFRSGIIPDILAYRLSRWKIDARMTVEDGIDDVIDTVIEIQPGYQHYRLRAAQLPGELAALTRLVADRNPTTVMEIGTAQGGTFYTWCRCFDTTNTVISLDLPEGPFGGGYSERQRSLYSRFAPEKDLYFVRDDSHSERTYEHIAEGILGNGAQMDVDFLFIDGDHTYEGVKQDFEMYSRLLADDGIVAFHDIVPHPDDPAIAERRREEIEDVHERHFRWGESWRQINVDTFWSEVRDEYDTEEFIAHPKQTWGGIGVVYF